MKDSPETQARRTTLQAAMAVAALGFKFYDVNGVTYLDQSGMSTLSLWIHTRDWTPTIRDAVVEELDDALRIGAYFIERVYMGHTAKQREKPYGYRLCSFMPGSNGGHSYHGETFTDADAFWSAMRTVQDLAERSKRK